MSLAKTFQRLILPSVERLKAEFPQSFVYYQPKEDVGGDFYWYYKNGCSILVAADGTGHGVTGSYVHFMGHAFLTEIVERDGQTNPSRILSELDKRMRDIAKLKGLTSEMETIGMDVAVIRIFPEKEEVDFCGANLPCYVVRDGKTVILERTKRGIGGVHEPHSEAVFSTKNFRLKKGDMLYLSSDGYHDQFGGPDDKKMGNVRFSELLAEASHLGIVQQRNHLRRAFDDWKDGREQTDDVMVIGIQI